MKYSKNVPMALAIMGIGAVASFAEVKVSDNLSLSGFLDMSTSGFASTEDNAPDPTQVATFDQFEVDFLLKFGDYTARADINSLGGGAMLFEQGFITASLIPGMNLTFGRFLSVSGFEAAEPTGLYQYSQSKLLTGYAGPTYGGYQNGVNFSYTAPMFGVYVSAVNSVWGGSTDFTTPAGELQIALMPVAGLTAKATFLYENELDTTDQSEANVWVSFAQGPITVAGEFSYLMDWGTADETGMGYLAMANFKATDKLAFTGRFSSVQIEDLDPDMEVTFSPSFAISPNWLVLAEVRQELSDRAAPGTRGPTTGTGTAYAAEATFSF